MHLSGQRICSRSWNLPKNSTKDLSCCTPLAQLISSPDMTFNISKAANAFCCSSRGNCWTCSVTLNCRKRFRDSFILHKEWWRCFAVCQRTTYQRRASRTGRGGENSPLRTSLLSTFPLFWSLSLTVRKTYHTYLCICNALKEQFAHK